MIRHSRSNPESDRQFNRYASPHLVKASGGWVRVRPVPVRTTGKDRRAPDRRRWVRRKLRPVEFIETRNGVLGTPIHPERPGPISPGGKPVRPLQQRGERNWLTDIEPFTSERSLNASR